MNPPALGFGVAIQDCLRGDVGEVEGFPALDSALAARQGKQRVDEAFLLVVPVQGLLAHRPQGDGSGVRIGERDLQQGPFRRERCPQLVGGVGDEMPLGLK